MTAEERKYLLWFKEKQLAGEKTTCPICGFDSMKMPISSNPHSILDNQIRICESCAELEPLFDEPKGMYSVAVWEGLYVEGLIPEEPISEPEDQFARRAKREREAHMLNDEMRHKLVRIKADQLAGKHTICPVCGLDSLREPMSTNTPSLLDSQVRICARCSYVERVMNMVGDYYYWKALRPEKPEPPWYYASCSPRQLWDHVMMEQGDTLFYLLSLAESGTPWKEVNYQLIKSCPGAGRWHIGSQLIRIWYPAAGDQTLVIDVRRRDNGEAEITGGPGPALEDLN